MGKQNIVSGILVFVAVLMIAISTFMVVTYSTGILTAAVAFASTDQVAKLESCGVTLPQEIFKLKADIPSLLVPAVYVGYPGLMIILSILMFVAGFYFAAGREAHSSSSSTTTTTSPNRSKKNGRYAPGRRVEKTQTRRTSSNEVK